MDFERVRADPVARLAARDNRLAHPHQSRPSSAAAAVLALLFGTAVELRSASRLSTAGIWPGRRPTSRGSMPMVFLLFWEGFFFGRQCASCIATAFSNACASEARIGFTPLPWRRLKPRGSPA